MTAMPRPAPGATTELILYFLYISYKNYFKWRWKSSIWGDEHVLKIISIWY